MNDENTKILREQLEPIAETFKETFIKAMLLRVSVAWAAGIASGAEPEDIGEIILEAIASSHEITSRFLDEVGNVSDAKKLSKMAKEQKK